MRISFLTFLLFFCLTMSGQEYNGTVVNSQENPLENVTVILVGSSGRTTLRFSRTDKTGRFLLSTPQGRQGDALIFNSMGYERDTLAVEDYTPNVVIHLNEKAVELKEVKVKAPSMTLRGDTIDYLVSSFIQKQDRTLSDVLKRMTGLKVEKDGTILYQGKPLEKVYIEGMDLMGDKYSQATENLSAYKVKKVQVYENHQPIKMLQGKSFSEQAALNIVLTDDAKNVWQGTADLGLGAELQGSKKMLGDVRLTEMLFARKLQSISMYKFNNTGNDIFKEIATKNIFGSVASERNLIENIAIRPPSLDMERTSFNTSHLLATNWLFKTGKDNEIRLQVDGVWDRGDMWQHNETRYTNLSYNNATIIEDMDATAWKRSLSGELLYKLNSQKTFLSNTLKLSGDFSTSHGLGTLNGVYTPQFSEPRGRRVSDRFEWMQQLKNNRTYSMNGYFSYNYLPNRLLLTDSTMQRLTQESLFWGAKTYLRGRIGHIVFSYILSTDGKSQTIDLSKDDDISRDRYVKSDTRFTPSFSYETDFIRINLQMPVSWYYRRFEGQDKHNLLFLPNLYVDIEPSAYWSMNANYSYTWNEQDINALSALPIFYDYNSVLMGVGTFYQTTIHTLGVGAKYKNTRLKFFSNLKALFLFMGKMPLHTTYLQDNVYHSVATDKRARMNTIDLRGSMSKHFDWAKSSLTLDIIHRTSNYSILVLDDIKPFRTLTDYIQLIFSMQPSDWFSAEAESNFTHTKQINLNDRSASGGSVQSFNHNVKLFFMPGNWQIKWTNEFYHSNDPAVSFKYFSDIGISYRQKRYELRLDLNNLWGNDTYEERRITDLFLLYSVSRLRPRSILASVSLSF